MVPTSPEDVPDSSWYLQKFARRTRVVGMGESFRFRACNVFSVSKTPGHPVTRRQGPVADAPAVSVNVTDYSPPMPHGIILDVWGFW